MSARLAIDDGDHYGEFRIGWLMTDEQEFGAMIGDERYTEAKLAEMTDREDRECALAYLAALKTDGIIVRPRAIWWESRRSAQKALRAIKAAIANADHPWPDWAVKARAEGWTPPKGWKP